MPRTDSSLKANRQNIKRRKQNARKRDLIKNYIRTLRQMVKEKKQQEAKALLPKFYKALDKAVKTNFIHKNKAARLKSRLTHSIGKT